MLLASSSSLLTALARSLLLSNSNHEFDGVPLFFSCFNSLNGKERQSGCASWGRSRQLRVTSLHEWLRAKRESGPAHKMVRGFVAFAHPAQNLDVRSMLRTAAPSNREDLSIIGASLEAIITEKARSDQWLTMAPQSTIFVRSIHKTVRVPKTVLVPSLPRLPPAQTAAPSGSGYPQNRKRESSRSTYAELLHLLLVSGARA